MPDKIVVTAERLYKQWMQRYYLQLTCEVNGNRYSFDALTNEGATVMCNQLLGAGNWELRGDTL